MNDPPATQIIVAPRERNPWLPVIGLLLIGLAFFLFYRVYQDTSTGLQRLPAPLASPVVVIINITPQPPLKEVVLVIPTESPKPTPTWAPVPSSTPGLSLCPQPVGVTCRWPMGAPPTSTPYPTCVTPVPEQICISRAAIAPTSAPLGGMR